MYVYPKLSRAGLGNCMLPWARAVVFQRRNAARMLAPQWVQPRLGAWIRNERAKRFYFGEFTNTDYLKGARKHLLLRVGRNFGEDEFTAGQVSYGRRPAIIVFEGLRNYFDDIQGSRALINSELQRIVNPAILQRVASFRQPFVAVNMRRGDLTNQGWSDERLMGEPRYTPTAWFVSAMQAISHHPNWQRLPIVLISDGRDTEIAPLLGDANCKLVTTGSAIGDILLLANAKLLVASGHSTFSMWASYLGEMPTIYYPGKMQQRVFAQSVQTYEGEWRPGTVLPQPCYG